MKVLNAKTVAKPQQQGFTIIELIVVILLLGILTATALPRFIDVTDQAHDAVVDATYGGLATGSSLFRAAYIAAGEPTAGALVPGFGPGALGTVRANAVGYPIGTAAGTVVDSIADCASIFTSLLQSGAATVVAGTQTSATAAAAADIGGTGGADFEALYTSPEVCYYAYIGQYADTTESTAAGDVIPVIVYDTATGTITLGDETSI